MAKPSLNSNALYAYRYFQDKYKLAPHQAAGVVGNLMQESTFNTGARNAGDGSDGSDSIGIGQWNGARARNLKAFGGDNYNNLDTQLDFVMHEMNGEGGKNGAGSERYAYNQLMNAKDVHGATAAMISFERPSGWSQKNPTAGHGFDNRLSWAGEVMGLSPDEIANASPSSASIAPLAMAQTKAAPASPAASAAQVATAAPDLSLSEKLGFGKMPEKILGMDVNKGIDVFGSMSKMLEQQTQAQNQQAQQTAQMGQARRAGASAPIEITPAQSAVMQSGGIGGASNQMDEMKKRMLLARLLGNGGGGLLG